VYNFIYKGNENLVLTDQLFDEVGLISDQPSVSEQLPLVEQRLAQTHRELGTNLQLQRRDINLIEEDMQQYPLNIASEVLRPQITQIKVIASQCYQFTVCVSLCTILFTLTIRNHSFCYMNYEFLLQFSHLQVHVIVTPFKICHKIYIYNCI
jgi:hypothetical protein